MHSFCDSFFLFSMSFWHSLASVTVYDHTLIHSSAFPSEIRHKIELKSVLASCLNLLSVFTKTRAQNCAAQTHKIIRSKTMKHEFNRGISKYR